MSEAAQTNFNSWKWYAYQETQKIVQTLLQSKKYSAVDSKEWTNRICQEVSNCKIKIITKLCKKNQNFKYIVTCIILAAGSNGMDIAGLCYWDQEMDGSVTVKWDNLSMCCIVNIYACSL